MLKDETYKTKVLEKALKVLDLFNKGESLQFRKSVIYSSITKSSTYRVMRNLEIDIASKCMRANTEHAECFLMRDTPFGPDTEGVFKAHFPGLCSNSFGLMFTA